MIGIQKPFGSETLGTDSRFSIHDPFGLRELILLIAVLFGIGWGLAGLCPGPAIAALSFGGAPAWVFLGTMSAGVALFDLSPLAVRRPRPSPAA